MFKEWKDKVNNIKYNNCMIIEYKYNLKIQEIERPYAKENVFWKHNYAIYVNVKYTLYDNIMYVYIYL